MNVNDVVQFNENHKWRGCLGIIRDIKRIYNPDPAGNKVNDIRYMIGVPIPQKGTAYIYVLESEKALEKIGEAVLIAKECETND
jgi:hypothetical protein